MKKITNYLLLFFMSASVLFVTSCGDDAEDILGIGGATISELQVDGEDSSQVTREPGEAVTVGVAYDLDNAEGISLVAYLDYNDSVVVSAIPLSSTSQNPIQVTFTVPTDVEETFVVTYELRDSDGSSVDSQDLTVNIEEDVEAVEYTTVLLAAPIGQTPGERTSSTFFSATDGETYSVEDVVNETGGVTSADIHFGYYWLNSTGAVISSPAEYNEDVYNLGPNGAGWGTLNTTMFRPITSSDYDTAVSSDEVADLFETPASSEESGAVDQLDTGDAYAFSYDVDGETHYGIFRVVSVEPGFESNDSITISVKVEASEE